MLPALTMVANVVNSWGFSMGASGGGLVVCQYRNSIVFVGAYRQTK